MAFYFSADAMAPVDNVGQSVHLVYGSTVLSGGTATVTIPQASVVKCAFASSQTSNAARVSATATNTFTLTGTTTDRVDWLAVVTLKG